MSTTCPDTRHSLSGCAVYNVCNHILVFRLLSYDKVNIAGRTYVTLSGRDLSPYRDAACDVDSSKHDVYLCQLYLSPPCSRNKTHLGLGPRSSTDKSAKLFEYSFLNRRRWRANCSKITLTLWSMASCVQRLRTSANGQSTSLS